MRHISGGGEYRMRTRAQRWIVAIIAGLTMGWVGPTVARCQSATSAGASSAKATEVDSVEAHLGRGYDALRDSRYEVAADEFRAALKLDPKLTLRARFPLAVALFEMKKADEARAEFEAVRQETGNHPNVAYYVGRIDLDAQHYEDAIRNLRAAVAEPPFPDTAYYLGFAFFKNGDLASAEKWLKQATEVNAHDSRAQYQLAMVYRAEGRDAEAKAAMALSGEQRQRDASTSQIRFECAKKLEQGSKEEAHAVCDQLYDPNDADKLTELGTLYGQHGDVESALKPLERAAELAPQSAQMQYNVALAYFQLNRLEEARGPLSKAASRWPDIFRIAALYGAVLAKLGYSAGAYQALSHAHRLDGKDVATGDLLFLTTLAVARGAQGSKKYAEAMRYFQEAAKLKAQEPSPHRGLASVYRLQGKAAMAVAEEREAGRLEKALQTR